MENSFYLFTDDIENLKIERFHICSWDFRDGTGLAEFGIEVDQACIQATEKSLKVKLVIPWLDSECTISDFYLKLKDLSNSKFIFNDVAFAHEIFDDQDGKTGCIQKFKYRSNLCLLPILSDINGNVLEITVDLKGFHKKKNLIGDANFYFRFGVERKKKKTIALKKFGINKTTYIYDLKVNEKRNLSSEIMVKYNCLIKSVFYFIIIPNDFNLNFHDSKTLKNIRTLEYNGFKKYLADSRVKNNDLIVVSLKDSNKDSYSFFNLFTSEILGVGVLALALLMNLLCGILLFLPTLRSDDMDHNILNLPWELYLAGSVWVIIAFYFLIKKAKPNWIKW